jgi:5-formyltetrahydrofolate cyclo-ligase
MLAMTAQARKQQLRQSIIAGRAALPEELHLRLSREISARLLLLAPYREARTVLGYMHFGAEFVSEPWLQQVLRDGKRLMLPKVNTATRELDVYHVEDVDAQLAPGAYGIREPQPERCTQLTRLEEIDFILLPGVAFGRDGARLGYGGGYYDKLLMKLLAARPGEQTTLARSPVTAHPDNAESSTHRPALAAAAFAMQLVESLPQEATDRKVEWLVTEHETIHCAAPDGRGAWQNFAGEE